jgi:secondary thiamine-phosphate synthase enzyme
MDTKVMHLHNGSELITELTGEIAQFCRGRGDGLCHVFVPHATAGLALIELGAGSERDAQAAIDALLPRDARWVHRHGSPGHGADHVLPAFVGSSLTLPVLGGRIALGTWMTEVDSRSVFS